MATGEGSRVNHSLPSGPGGRGVCRRLCSEPCVFSAVVTRSRECPGRVDVWSWWRQVAGGVPPARYSPTPEAARGAAAATFAWETTPRGNPCIGPRRPDGDAGLGRHPRLVLDKASLGARTTDGYSKDSGVCLHPDPAWPQQRPVSGSVHAAGAAGAGRWGVSESAQWAGCRGRRPHPQPGKLGDSALCQGSRNKGCACERC